MPTPWDPFRAESVEVSAAPAPEPVEPEPVAPVVPSGSTREVLEWVGGDVERAAQALAVEEADDNPRNGLVKELKELLEVEED